MPDRLVLTSGPIGRRGLVKLQVLACDGLLAVLAWGSFTLVSVVFLWLIGDLLWHGSGILSWSFLTQRPLDAGRAGGIGPILVSTALILLVCLGASMPLGLGAAVFLAEYTRKDYFFSRVIRRSLDILAGVPSIVFGLVGNAFFCLWLGFGFSILSGGLTLACMVLPILIRTTEEGLRSVPADYRMGAAALGLSRVRTLFHVLLPVAAPGLLAGLILGIGRALAETAALIFTSGYVDRTPRSLMDSGRSLSIHIYDLSMNVVGGERHAYATALVLVGLLMMINMIATALTDRWLGGRIAS